MNDEQLRDNIAHNIIFYRKNAGLTQTELGEALGYSDKSVSKWERGDGVPDVYVLARMAEMWHIDVSDLLKAEPPKVRRRLRWPVWLLSAGIVWLAAVIAYFVLMLAWPGMSARWLVFLYAVPACCIVMLVFACLRGSLMLGSLFTSGIIWGVAVSVQVTLSKTLALHSGFMLYIIAGVLQIMTVLWYILRAKKRKDPNRY